MNVAADAELRGGWRVARYQSDGERHPDRPPDLDGLYWLPATVPGAVNYDLVAAGAANPYASAESAAASRWVAEADWIYTRTLPATAGAYAIELDGVDTYADVWLNGTLLGRTANAYRRYRFDIPETLTAVEAELVIHVKGHRRMVEHQLAEARARIGVQGGHPDRLIKSLVRRYQRNSFSTSSLLNLGVHVHGIGLYKPVRLLVGERVRIAGARPVVEGVTGDSVRVRVEVTTVSPAPVDGTRVGIELVEPDTGRTVAGADAELVDGTAAMSMTVTEAQLWWPRGYGEAYLYRLRVRLTAGGRLLHERTTEVGLRHVQLCRRRGGRPGFGLRVNGVDVYVRGTNFIPVDYLKVHDDWPVYQRLLRLIEHGDYNLVRLWGGGAVEDDRFFQRCDQLGIMIWQDLFLHSNPYPDYDPAFLDEFRAEARELLLRMRDHPSLVLVCGGNEQVEGWDEWYWKLDVEQFYGRTAAYEVGAEQASLICPELPFIGNSPHGGRWAQSPVEGDTHTWGNFFNATKDPQFVTETCWSIESYSRPQTLREVMGLDVGQFNDRSWARRWAECTGMAPINKFPFSAYHDFDSLEEYLRGLEIEQAMADYHALSMLRLRSSSCTGIVYWSFNKGGPLFPFGSVDYGGRPLMSYYVIKRLLGEVVVGVYRDIDDIQVVATNGTGASVDAVLTLTHLDADGQARQTRRAPVTVDPHRIVRLLTMPSYYSEIRDRTREAIHAELAVGGEVVSRDTLYFCPLSEIRAAGTIRVGDVRPLGGGGWSMELATVGLVKMVRLECERRMLFSDNYFTLVPGRSRCVRAELLDPDDGQPPAVTVGALDGIEVTVELPR